MSTLSVQNEPIVEEWLARRRRLGQDGRDEVWKGVYHVSPDEHVRNSMTGMQLAFTLRAAATAAGLRAAGPFNLGTAEDYRIPDLAFLRDVDLQLYMPTAALVIEVLSPSDETFATFDFYAAHDVEELWVVDPFERTVRIWQRSGAGWDEVGRSDLLGLAAAGVAGEVDWPAS